VTSSDAHRAIDAVWRIESARLIAGLARLVGDLGLAEELAQDALVAALEQWPRDGVPDNPGAWLMATAKHRAIDAIRRQQTLRRKHQQIAVDLRIDGEGLEPDLDAELDDDIGDDLLRLVFTACHPVLPTQARVALTLRVLGGLSTDEIARAFLVPEATVAQRIVRAKRALAKAEVPFEVPRGDELTVRLESVLEVIYLIFNEGYSATAGDDWLRPELCADALRLGRIVAGLMPAEPEVHGLVALLEIQASRTRARTDPSGRPILLLDQNRAHWDRLLIRRGLAALARAGRSGPGRAARRGRRTVCPASRHRRLPCSGHHRGADRLEPDRRALPGARLADALAGGRAEPGGRGRHGVRAASRTRPARAAHRGSAARVVPSTARGPGRPVVQAGPVRRGQGRLRAGRRDDQEQS
jgi:RNA polymerase sigma factor (sigma-70 family)